MSKVVIVILSFIVGFFLTGTFNYLFYHTAPATPKGMDANALLHQDSLQEEEDIKNRAAHFHRQDSLYKKYEQQYDQPTSK